MTAPPSLKYNPEPLAVSIPASGRLEHLRPFQIVSLLDMYEFYASFFVEVANWIGAVVESEKPLSAKERENWLKPLLVLGERCEKAGLKVSDGHVTNIVYDVREKKEKLKDAQFKQRLKALVDSLVIELDGTLFLHIPFPQALSYNKPFEKWEQVITRFPGTVRDIEEAQKCLALSRYTAAVFHSLQVVEVGLIELGSFIGVNDPTSGWTSVANRLKKIIETKYQDRTAFEQANSQFLEQVQGTVEALKNAWRNKVSHAHGRLTLMTGEEFHPDVAEEILLATRAFMRRLAEGLPP